jgi:hypothetical protein
MENKNLRSLKVWIVISLYQTNVRLSIGLSAGGFFVGSLAFAGGLGSAGSFALGAA